MVKDLSVTGARTAQEMYGAGGWVAHHNTDLWRATGPIDFADSGMWPSGGAWLCDHLWDHYEFNPDKAYLKEVYPVMRGAAQFFLDTLVEDPTNHWLVTSPSVSPENQHPFGSAVCAGPTMDEEILRDLFANCIKASKILDTDSDFRQLLGQTRAALRRRKSERKGSCRNGWRIGMRKRGSSITATSRICMRFSRARKSRCAARRNSPRPPKSVSTNAGTSRPAGPLPGASTVGRACMTATAPISILNPF